MTSAPEVGGVLFTDLVGFTEFTSAAGDGRALAALDAQTELVNGVLAACRDARIVKELGDGLMVWFGSASDPLGCTIDVMHAARAARAQGGFPLAMRLGLHHGPVLERGDDLVGQTVNIAARVCDLAGPDELIVSEAVLDRCGAIPVTVEPIGPTRVRGVPDPIWLYRVSP